jgi:hypothetical protein
MKSGYGEFRYGNGKVYEGGWKRNRMHGEGRVIYPDGTVKCGLWESGRRVGIGSKMMNAGIGFVNKPTGQTKQI